MDFSRFCNELIDKTDLVRVVSRYVHLSRSGNDLVAPCPFHQETKPSFRVHPDKQYYHCFGCKKGGNAITFLADIENIDRIDAIRMLADEANMELPEFSGTVKAFDKNKRVRLYALMRDAAMHYYENLSYNSSEIATKYIEKRKIPSNIVTRFGIGYSNGDALIKHLTEKGYTMQEMKEAGIAAEGNYGWYDVFSKRLIFPIISNTGDVVGFGGRALTEDAFPKYRNSSQTELFDKSRIVYALNLLKSKKRKGGRIDYVIMCEGYMDVISLHKAGFDTAVASMGTALTQTQARQLKLYTDKVIISYDGDNAGQTATLRGLDILREAGLIVKVAQLEGGKDPDEIIANGGAEAYQKILNEAITLTQYKLHSIKSGKNLSDPDERSKYTLEAVKVIKELKNPIEIEEYLKIVQSETGYSMDVLKQQCDIATLDNKMAIKPPIIKDKTVKEYKLETFIIAALINKEPYAYTTEDMIDLMPDETLKKIMSAIIDGRLRSMKHLQSDIYDLGEDGDNVLERIRGYQFIEGDNKEKFDDHLNSLRYANVVRQIDELTASLSTSADSASVMGEIMKLNKKKAEIRKQESGGNK